MDIQQAINLGLYEEFEKEGIEFAYPTQALYLDRTEQDSSSLELANRQDAKTRGVGTAVPAVRNATAIYFSRKKAQKTQKVQRDLRLW